MTYLFTDITDFKDFVGGAVSMSMEMDSLKPTMFVAAKNHIIPWLGTTTWNNLVDGVTNSDLTADEENLLPYVQRPLAWLTVWEYSKMATLQFGENGLFRMETDDFKTPFKYQETQFKTAAMQNGFEALEWMLQYLDANAGTYSDWQSSEGFARTRAYFINYAEDFRTAHSKAVTRYAYEMLRPVIEELEIFAILPCIGQTLFDALKADILAGTLTGQRLSLVRLIRKAMAHFSIEEGMKKHWIKFEGDRVVFNEQLEPQSYERLSIASEGQMSVKLAYHDEFGNRHMSYIKKFLTDNIGDFPEYQTYLDELAAAAEAEAAAEADDCCDDARSYYPHCNCQGSCTCSSKSTRKSIFRI